MKIQTPRKIRFATQWIAILTFAILIQSSFCEVRPDGDTAGNGGDTLRLIFKDAQMQAKDTFKKILSCSIPKGTTNDIQTWLLIHRDELADDIERSNHVWGDFPDQNTCAETQRRASADIKLSFTSCKNSPITEKLAFELLVHESAHHLGIDNETTADMIAKAASNATLANNCGEGNSAKLALGYVEIQTLSKNGEYLATFDKQRGLLIWDAVRGKLLSTYENINPYIFVGFNKNVTKYFFIFNQDNQGRDQKEIGWIDLKTMKFGHSSRKIIGQMTSQSQQYLNATYGEWSSDGRYLAFIAGTADTSHIDSLIVFDTKEEIFFIGPRLILTPKFKFQPNTSLISVFESGRPADTYCQLSVYDFITGEFRKSADVRLFKNPEDDGRCHENSLSDDGATLYSSETYFSIHLRKWISVGRFWDVNSGNPIREFDIPYLSYNAGWSAPNIIAWFEGKYALTWRKQTESGMSIQYELISPFQKDPVIDLQLGTHYLSSFMSGTYASTFYEEGKQIAITSWDANTRLQLTALIDTATGKVHHTYDVVSGTFSINKEGILTYIKIEGNRYFLMHQRD